jgi:protein-S-isoprenylcysteine O-methyltransferase Ste14
MYAFIILLLLGFALAGASACTAAYSRLWGERGGQFVTSLLRNILGIPLWCIGFVLAWIRPASFLLTPRPLTLVLGWLLIASGAVPAIWGHLQLGWRTHMPSVRDTLVYHGLYAHARHPIYAGMLLVFAGVALLRPTLPVVLACALGCLWLIVQAKLEEVDLLQRLPAYREYMAQVPRFVPRLWRRQSCR